MEEERLLKEQGKKYSLKDGASSSVMEGMGLKYITPYALSLGLSNKLIGILEVLPTLIANILRIFLSKAYYKNLERIWFCLSYSFRHFSDTPAFGWSCIFLFSIKTNLCFIIFDNMLFNNNNLRVNCLSCLDFMDAGLS